MLTAAVAAVVGAAASYATLGLAGRGTDTDVRAYLLAHPEVIPEAMQHLQDRETGKTVAANRGAIVAAVGDAWLGNPRGDVTVVEYFDYNCTYCRSSLPTIAALVKADPKVKVVFRELPVLSQSSYDAAKLSYAAARQGKFRAFHDALYRAGPVTPQTMAKVAAAAGVDAKAAAATAGAAEVEIKTNLDVARKLGMTGTPSWVIGDRAVSGMLPLADLQAAVKAARGR